MGNYTLAFNSDMKRTNGTFSSVVFGALGLIGSLFYVCNLAPTPTVSAFELGGRLVFIGLVTFVCLSIRVIDLDDYE